MNNIRTTLSLLVALSIFASLSGQKFSKTTALSEIFPFLNGDTLIYDILSPVEKQGTFSVTLTGEGLDEKTYMVAEPNLNQIQWKKYVANKGLFLLKELMINGQIVLFQSPLQLLPAHLDLGKSYTYQSTFQVLDQTNKVIETGEQKVVIRVLGYDAAMTPLQNFAKCLVLDVTTVKKFKNSGQEVVIQSKQWHVKDIGLVKLAEKQVIASVEKEKMTMTLKKAKVEGEWME